MRERQGRERDGGRKEARETGKRKRWREEDAELDRREMEGGRGRDRQTERGVEGEREQYRTHLTEDYRYFILRLESREPPIPDKQAKTNQRSVKKNTQDHN